MATFGSVVKSLRKAEKELEKQLAGIRSAIASLSFGSAASMVPSHESTRIPRKRKAMSKKARAAIAVAQKKRWAEWRRTEAKAKK
jgi:hypothetical protein